jgi:hypothetical protein
MVVESDFGADIVPTTDLELNRVKPAAAMRAVHARPVASANRALRTDVDAQGASAASVLFGMGIMWAIVLFLTGILTTLLPAGGGWPIVTWATALDHQGPAVAGAVAGLLGVLGIGAFVLGARAEPTSWGLIVAAPGLLADAVVVAGFAVETLPRLTGNGGFDALERVLFPWPTVLVCFGISVLALRQAWGIWASLRPGRTGGAAVGVVVAAAALFAAVQIARGAEAAPPTTFSS